MKKTDVDPRPCRGAAVRHAALAAERGGSDAGSSGCDTSLPFDRTRWFGGAAQGRAAVIVRQEMPSRSRSIFWARTVQVIYLAAELIRCPFQIPLQ